MGLPGLLAGLLQDALSYFVFGYQNSTEIKLLLVLPYKSSCSKMSWAALGLPWDSLGCSGVLWAAPGGDFFRSSAKND